MKLKKFKIILMLSVMVFAGTAQAEVLFEDNFDSYDDDINAVPDAVMLDETNNIWVGTLQSASGGVWSTVPWGTGALGAKDVKIGTIAPNVAYFSNNHYADEYVRLCTVTTIVGLSDYIVKVEAWEQPDRFLQEYYAVGRIGGSGAVGIRVGAVLGVKNSEGIRGVYLRVADSGGYSYGDHYVTQWDTNEPINVELALSGDSVVGTVSHVGYSYTHSWTTTVLDAGDPGFGGRNIWDYAVGNFDNFEVRTPTCGDPGTVYNAGDINQDCYVNMLDVAKFVTEWLECTDPNDAGCDQYWK